MSLASFSLCLGYRLVKGAELWSARSKCDFCEHPLDLLSLLPFLGWILRRGKCCYCSRQISFLYPAIEILMGFVSLFLFIKLGLSLSFIFVLFFLFLFLINAYSDYFLLEVFDSISNFCVAFAVLFFVSRYGIDFGRIGLVGLIAVLFCLFIWTVSVILRKKVLGEGDYLVLFAILLVLPDVFFEVLAVACSIGILYCLFKKERRIPFYPFLLVGTVVGLLVW